uniref:Cytochrome b n=1 Tax=Carpoglyphus lactis TaxID=223459 RepID=A0A7D5AJ33_CARLC|nr:cytochrome b [Carpoglyphus lactis]QKV10195.1 cytochrome b [Carpoglyphus lactis]
MKKYNLFMKDPVVMMMKSSLLNTPTPYSISFLWNMGFILGMTLVLQIVTGLVLSMNYVAHTSMAFDSVIHIMRDLDAGYIMRYLHMNGASLFFMAMFIHIGRGIYFNSPMKLPTVWVSGGVIFLLSMGTAFMGYVLPWGQMSFWGATVITTMISAIPYVGKDIMLWLWGNFSVSQPTLNRFLSFHFILPLVIMVVVMIHLVMLHKTGSSSPTGVNPDYDKMKFYPYFAVKDFTPLMVIFIVLAMLLAQEPNMLGDVENYNQASMASTPPHIQPEWYFLFAYAILRSIPSKLGGVVAMLASVLVIFTLLVKSPKLSKKFSPAKKVSFWVLVFVWLLLTWIGANPVEDPFISVGAGLTALYFSLFIVV